MIQVVGDGFGRDCNDVRHVMVCGSELPARRKSDGSCLVSLDADSGPGFVFVSRYELLATVPSGVGACSISVQGASGLSSSRTGDEGNGDSGANPEVISITYDQPNPSTMQPKYALFGERWSPDKPHPAGKAIVCGSNFPQAPADVGFDTFVSLGGIDCVSVSFHSPGCLHCGRYEAPSSPYQFESLGSRTGIVNVTIAGTRSNEAAGLFQALGPPGLLPSSSRVVSPETAFIVRGINLGMVAGDVGQVVAVLDTSTVPSSTAASFAAVDDAEGCMLDASGPGGQPDPSYV